MLPSINTLISNTFIPPLAAFCAYGGWVAYINYAAAHQHWWGPGLSHGLYAAALTGVMKPLVGWSWQRLAAYRQRRLIIMVMASLVTILCPMIIQFAVGNRQITLSILPGIIIGHAYLYFLIHSFAIAATPSATHPHQPEFQQINP